MFQRTRETNGPLVFIDFFSHIKGFLTKASSSSYKQDTVYLKKKKKDPVRAKRGFFHGDVFLAGEDGCETTIYLLVKEEV